MARLAAGTTEQQLKDIAAQEMAATKARLTTRTAAARQYATAKLVDAQQAWQLAQGEALEGQARSIEELIRSGMKPGDVANLLGVDAKELKTLRSTSNTTSEQPAHAPSLPAA